MLGWEFPPHITGGLGTACYGLTRGLRDEGVTIYFVLPRPIEPDYTSHVHLLAPGAAPVRCVGEAAEAESRPEPTAARGPAARPGSSAAEPEPAVAVPPYGGEGPAVAAEDLPPEVLAALAPEQRALLARRPIRGFVGPAGGGDYSGDLLAQVRRYADLAERLADGLDFDVIHAHDWITFPAGVRVAERTGRPLIVHVHSTEFDRSGAQVNPHIYAIEREGVQRADRVIAVSYLTRNILIHRYDADPERTVVVYNAIDLPPAAGEDSLERERIGRDEKIVLFLGRVTMQKGPEYFLAAARRVLQVMDNVRFIVAGSGDQIRRMIELAAEMGIGRKVLFTGFLRGADLERAFRMADLYVMPSVSEPFGLACLEAMSHDVPVIVSRQSGVAEVLRHVLKVDFWDIDEMANKIVAVLRHPPLGRELRRHASLEVRQLSWRGAARRCIDVYEAALRERGQPAAAPPVTA